ncbi:MAG: hypothetical protein FWH04_02590 [Oscillospiraceae bacterium]|nr:hypothetical protein [Oscillospiraceae bacterium]
MWVYWFIVMLIFNIFMFYRQSVKTKKRLEDAQKESQEVRNLDEKVYRLYQEIESMLDNFEIYVNEVHDELESRRTEILEMSRQATTLYMQVMQPGAFGNVVAITPPKQEPEKTKPQEQEVEEPKAEPKAKAATRSKAKPKPKTSPPPETQEENLKEKAQSSGRLSERDQKELEKLDTKGKKVHFLMGRGLTIDETARELSMGKGEIQLIVDLDKK